MPNPLFNIQEKEIEFLLEPEFVDVLNKLLKAESQRFGIPVHAVNTTMRLNDPDGGVDARVEHSISLPPNSRIPMGLSVWQYKHGDSSIKEITKETKKPGVQDAIIAGGAYCYVTGKGYGDRARRSRENILSKACTDRGLTPNSKLFTAQNVADWVSEYPPVAMLSYFRRPVHDELLTFEQWLGLPELRIDRIGFEADQQRQKIINEIGETITKQFGLISLRIAGRAGVGKTRLTLEAIRANRLDVETLYARSIEGVPSNLFSSVEANPHIRMVLVVDETTYEDAVKLHQLASRCKGRLFLITVGHDAGLSGSKTEIPEYYLDTLSDEAIKNLIGRAIPQPEILSFVVKASGGYVKLATALAESIVRNPSILGAAQLSGIPDVSIILESLIPDLQDRKVMEALSLLRRVGLEGDVASEGETLARFMGIDFRDMKRITEQMIRKGIVVKRGRYRYVTPHLLAVWFAVSLWRALSEDIVDELLLAEEGLSPIAAQSLLERLADLGEEDIATPVVEKLLNTEGLFAKLDDLNNEFRSKIFAILTEAAPKAAANALERVLGHMPRDELHFLNVGRRQIVWSLEKLLSWEDTFWIASRLLLKLAEAENESYANNATGVWCNIFQTHLGNTPVPAIDRHRLIQEALESDLHETRLIGVQAILRALSTYETGLGGIDTGGYIAPQAWRPKNWEEIWETRRSALCLLDRALADSSLEVAMAARNVLLNTAQGLVSQGMYDDVIPRLQTLPITSEQDKRELWELYKRILHFLSASLSDVQRTELQQIVDGLLGTNYHDRLRRWVGKVSPVDWKELKDQGKKPEEMATALAEEGFADPDLLRQGLSWLGSDEAVQGFSFFKRLGELDERHEWLNELIEVVRKAGNPNMLSVYLIGRSEAGEKEWVRQLLDGWSDSEQAMTPVIYETTRRLEGSERGAARVIKLIDKGWLAITQLGWLGWGKWAEPLSSSAIEALLEQLVKYEDPYSTEISLVLLMNWLKHHKDEDSKMLKYASKLLTRTSAINSQNMLQYYWEQLAEYYSDNLAVELAQAILQSFLEVEYISAHAEDARMNILRQALIKQPREVWQLIGEMLLRKDMKGYELRLSMRNWGIEIAGIANLLEWANSNKPIGPCILAELAIPLSELAYQLLLQFDNEECIGSGLAATFLSGSFWGSEAQWLQSKLKTALDWAENDQPAIRKWAQSLVSIIETDMKRARQREEEELL